MKDTNNKYFYLLKGLLECGSCKSRFYGLKRADLSSNYYGCSSQRHLNEWCKTKGVNIDYLDDLVINQIYNLDKDVKYFFDWYENNDMNHHYLIELTASRKKEKMYKSQIENLLELGIDGKIQKDIFNNKMDELNKKLAKETETKIHLLKQYSISNKKEDILSLVKTYIENIKTTSDMKLKREYIRGIVDKIYIQWFDNLQQHHIYIKYKIDNLTQYSLEKDIELTYHKAGYRLDRDIKFNQKLSIKKYLVNENNFLESPIIEIY